MTEPLELGSDYSLYLVSSCEGRSSKVDTEAQELELKLNISRISNTAHSKNLKKQPFKRNQHISQHCPSHEADLKGI